MAGSAWCNVCADVVRTCMSRSYSETTNSYIDALSTPVHSIGSAAMRFCALGQRVSKVSSVWKMDTRTKCCGVELWLAQEVTKRIAARSRGDAKKRFDTACRCSRGAAAEPPRLGLAGSFGQQAAALRAEMVVAVQLMSAEEPEERARLLRALLHVMGFSALAYARVDERAEHRLTAHAWALDDTAPHHFGRDYIEGGYGGLDPRLAAVSASSVPLVWDLDWLLRAWRRDGSPEALRGLFPALECEGVQSGVMFSIPTAPGGVRAVVSLAAGRTGAEWIAEHVFVQALAFGLSLHRFASDPRRLAIEVGAPDVVQKETLTEMQARILSCLVGGLSDKQIAARLQTTPHNVDYHLRLLRRRYGAANRTHLAFLLGGSTHR